MPATNYWNSNRSLTSLKHWASLNAPKTSTSQSTVGRYSKPQPSLMPDIDSTLHLTAQWKQIIATDLTGAFYQIPLSHDSMKYCGVATPFRGVQVYARSAMGIPGWEKALKELMSRVLGDLLKDGIVTKIADDLYCGGNSPVNSSQTGRKYYRPYTSVIFSFPHPKRSSTPSPPLY